MPKNISEECEVTRKQNKNIFIVTITCFSIYRSGWVITDRHFPAKASNARGVWSSYSLTSPSALGS